MRNVEIIEENGTVSYLPRGECGTIDFSEIRWRHPRLHVYNLEITGPGLLIVSGAALVTNCYVERGVPLAFVGSVAYPAHRLAKRQLVANCLLRDVTVVALGVDNVTLCRGFSGHGDQVYIPGARCSIGHEARLNRVVHDRESA